MDIDKTRTCFWFPPDLKCPPEGGYFRLGTLIADPDFLHMINMRDENPNDGMPYPAKLPGNAMGEAEPLAKYSIDIEDSTRPNNGDENIDFPMTILANAIREFAVKTCGLDYSPEHHAVVSALLSQYTESFRSLDIKPTDKYVEASLQRPEVQAQLREWRFRKRQYMITGFRVAVPVSKAKITTALAKLEDIEWVDSVPPPTDRVEVEYERKLVKKGSELANEVRDIFEHVSRESFVYAMRLRECHYGRKTKAGPDDQTLRIPEGLHLANDKEMKEENPDDYELVFKGVAEEDMHVSSMVGAAGEHIVTEDRLVDDVGGDPCYLHLYMFTALAMAGDLKEPIG